MSQLLEELGIETKHTYFGIDVDEDLHEELELLWPRDTYTNNAIWKRFRPMYSMLQRVQPHISFGVLMSCVEWLARHHAQYAPAVVKALRLYADRVESGLIHVRPDDRTPGRTAAHKALMRYRAEQRRNENG